MLVLSLLAAYMILTLKEVTVKPKTIQSSEDYNRQVQENIKKVEIEYQVGLKDIFRDYENMMQSQELDDADKVSGILKLRDEIKSLNVPAQYKEMHLNLFLAFSEVEKMGTDDLTEAVSNINELITEARNAYPWLNN